jgi:Holliday junction resolvasome RuvABC endonuclease subunit
MSNVLAFDPGAERCGWAVVHEGPSLEASGISRFTRTRNGKKVQYQVYRLELIDYWLAKAYDLMQIYNPDVVATEIVPVQGAGEGGGSAGLALAATVANTIQAVAKLEGIEVVQISAARVKRRIGGIKDATKVKVRNGVIELLPALESRRREWIDSAEHDETDAIALGLVYLGYAV